jgi:hypothetical protein
MASRIKSRQRRGSLVSEDAGVMHPSTGMVVLCDRGC